MVQAVRHPVTTTKQLGDRAEDLAVAHLQGAGLRLLARNYRMPGRGGCEIDLIMATPDGTCVFVEVRRRRKAGYGGAAASVGYVKQQHIILAARHYLARLRQVPPCRFDVVAVDAWAIDWLQAAFDAT